MAQKIRIERFSDKNINDYENLTKLDQNGKLCYCSFWHAKWASIDEYDKVKEDNPNRLKNCVIDKMRSNFHVGAIAYIDEEPGAWISVGPLTDFYWSWKRVAQLGISAQNIAGIMCFTIAPNFRGKGLQKHILIELINYGKQQKWTSIEAYPFSNEAILKHGDALKWPGLTKGYEQSGFTKTQDHWLSSDDYKRFIYNIDLEL